MNKNNFCLIFSYLKGEKLKLGLYLLLVIITYFPALISAFFGD